MAETTTHNMIIYVTVVLFLLKGVHNAPPQFVYFPTSIYVPESKTYGDVIWNCNATDGDNSSTPAGQLRYEFLNQGNLPKFFLDSRYCHMYVFTALDYESQQTYTFNIIVKDLHPTSPQTTTGTLTIHVTDVNDNAPTCDEYHGVLSVFEDVPMGSEIVRPTCTDEDRDKSTTGKVLFKVSDSNSVEVKDTFEVDNDNGSVTIKKKLDYERVKSYVLTIDVYDNAGVESLTTIITYNIQVKDVDDHKPTWRTRYTAVDLYRESSTLGTGVLTLTAYDADKPMTAASTITYGIQTPAVPDVLGIDSVTGTVYVKDIFNYRKSRLSMEVYAYSSNKSIDISVIIVNIELPEYYTSPFPVDTTTYNIPTETFNVSGSTTTDSRTGGGDDGGYWKGIGAGIGLTLGVIIIILVVFCIYMSRTNCCN